MTLPRLVVVEGPDVGAEFPIGSEGGGVGRGEGNVVKLTDRAVSRQHCSLRYVDGTLLVEDAGSRNHTLVNGKPITSHRLEDGDEIAIGKTRLTFLPAEGGFAVVPTGISRVTMEVSADELLRAKAKVGGQNHLQALARLGDGLRKRGDRAALLRLCCEVTRDALGADRAVLLLPDANGRLAPAAAAGGDEAAQLTLPKDVLDRVKR